MSLYFHIFYILTILIIWYSAMKVVVAARDFHEESNDVLSYFDELFGIIFEEYYKEHGTYHKFDKRNPFKAMPSFEKHVESRRAEKGKL